MSLMKRTIIWQLMLAGSAFACFFSSPAYKVSRSFSVLVKNDLGPVAGLKLKVYFFKFNRDAYYGLNNEQRHSVDLFRSQEIIAESTTDDTGTARFNLDRVGSFTLSPDSPAQQSRPVKLEVSDQPPTPPIDRPQPAPRFA